MCLWFQQYKFLLAVYRTVVDKLNVMKLTSPTIDSTIIEVFYDG